jgi:hypothetical protein
MPILKITHAEVRMYRMGTGDCFIIKFFADQKERLKMMIDCGTWKGTKDHLAKYIKDLKAYVNNEVDLLVITHEHKDHVYGFEACKELFTEDFKINKIWMGWTENDKAKTVKEWKKDHGEVKKALLSAANQLNNALNSEDCKAQFALERDGLAMLDARKHFAGVLNSLTDLQLSAVNGEYKGMLEGIRVVKEDLSNENIQYFRPGDIVENLEHAEGLRFYVLGPPTLWENVKIESGGKGESYDHNKDISGSDAFAAAVLNYGTGSPLQSILPFDDSYVLPDGENQSRSRYNDASNVWRKIDFEWLYSAGSLALRLNSLTNNLSLALAIEFTGSGRVMLFPGDAEYGSWSSWHTIKWNKKGPDEKHLTEDLLNRTIFYKVAHHLSHNGTARRLGMEMMTHQDLAAMATLDYGVISDGWKSTMPNRSLLKALLVQTKGRLLIMNDTDLSYDRTDEVPLGRKIDEERNKMSSKESKVFEKSFVEHPLYLQYTVYA